MKNTLRKKLIAALTLVAAGVCPCLHADDVSRVRLGSLKRDDLVVVDVQRSIDTNVVQQLIGEYDRDIVQPREIDLVTGGVPFPVTSVNSQTGDVVLVVGDIHGAVSEDALYELLAEKADLYRVVVTTNYDDAVVHSLADSDDPVDPDDPGDPDDPADLGDEPGGDTPSYTVVTNVYRVVYRDDLDRAVDDVLSDVVPATRTINGVSLDADIELGPADIGAPSLTNLVTSISDDSTDLQYPSAKSVYDALVQKQGIISDLESIRSGAAAGATAVQPEAGKGLSTKDYTAADQSKLSGIEPGAQTNLVEGISVNGTVVAPGTNKVVAIVAVTRVKGASEADYRTGDVSISPSDIGAAVPGDITITEIKVNGTKVDPVDKSVNISVPAAQVNADWNASSGVSEILNKPTLGTAAAMDVPASGNASTGQVVLGNDTRLTDARTPTAHNHTAAQITDLGTAAKKDVPASGNASTNQVVMGNDTRLTNARMPTAHASTHKSGESDAIAPSDIGAQAALSQTQLDNIAAVPNKAPLASPVFTGIPTAPDIDSTNNSSQVVTDAYLGRRLGSIDLSDYPKLIGPSDDVPLTGWAFKQSESYAYVTNDVDAVSTNSYTVLSLYSNGSKVWTSDPADASNTGWIIALALVLVGGAGAFAWDRFSTKSYVDELVNYSPISVTAFSASPSTNEQGSTVTSVTLSYTLNKAAASATLDGNPVTLSGKTGSISLTGLSLTSSKSWSLKVVEPASAAAETPATATRSAALSFLWQRHWGVAAGDASTVTDAFLNETLSGSGKSELATGRGKTFTVNAGAGQYIWYAVPTSFGQCSFKVGGFDGGFTLVKTFEHTNSSGGKTNYYVYRSDNPSLGSTSVTVA